MEQKIEDQKEVKKVNPLAILSYIGLLVLIPILIEKKDEFVKFHAKQGLILAIAEIATAMISWVPIIGWIVWTIGGLVWFILSIIGILNAINNKEEYLPVIGQFAQKLHF